MSDDLAGRPSMWAPSGWAERHPLVAGSLPWLAMAAYVALSVAFQGTPWLATGLAAILALLAWRAAYLPQVSWPLVLPSLAPGATRRSREPWCFWLAVTALCILMFATWSIVCQAVVGPIGTVTTRPMSASDVASVILLAPALEETLMRGLFLVWLLRCAHARPAAAVVATALVFALLHGNLLQGGGSFAFGIVLGIAYLRTGDLPLVVLMHAANNLVAVLLGSVAIAVDGMVVAVASGCLVLSVVMLAWLLAAFLSPRAR